MSDYIRFTKANNDSEKSVQDDETLMIRWNDVVAFRELSQRELTSAAHRQPVCRIFTKGNFTFDVIGKLADITNIFPR